MIDVPGASGDELLWSRLMTVFAMARDRLFAVLAQHALTPPHGFALSMLLDGPMRMRDMADGMTCDASYITAIVDRLEADGLAERRPSATDRRVKEIALTPAGDRVARDLHVAMTTPLPNLERLGPADRRALGRLLAKVVPDDEVRPDVFRFGPPKP